MLKKNNLLKVCLLIPAIVFCLNLNGVSAGQCPPPYDCPPNISTIPKTVQHPAGWLLAWDPTNPQVVNPESAVTVKIIGGVPPYTWSVSDGGFSLAYGETQGLSNSLLADDTACGPANIQVTDSRSDIAYGSVRCSDGRWSVYAQDGCVFGGVDNYEYQGGSEYAYLDTTKIEVGKYRQYQTKSLTWAGDWWPNCDHRPDHCEEAAATSIGRQCEPCLENRSDVPSEY